MKRLSISLHILFLLHLLVTFSQASFIAEAACLHCTAEMLSQPDCCAVGDKQSMAPMDSCETAAASSSAQCPHSGFCKVDSESLIFTVTAPVSADIDSAVLMLFSSAVLPNVSFQKQIGPGAVSRYKDLPRFIVHCSFLI